MSDAGRLLGSGGHVHVYRDGKLVVKWDLENKVPMEGEASRRILSLIEELEAEGLP